MKYFSIKPRIHFLQLKKLYEVLPQQYPDCPEDVTFEMQRTEVPLPKPCLSDWSSRHSQPLLWGEAGKLGPPGSVGWITQQLQMDTTSPFFPPSGFGLQIRLPQLPGQDCLSSEAFSLYFGLSPCPSQDLQNIHNTSCQECYISLSLSKYDWLAKIKAKLMISSKGT